MQTMRSVIDFTIALLALTVTSPIWIAVAIAIMIDSPGTPFYMARRIGKNGKPFRMWKFRTMVLNARQLGAAITSDGDPRMTRVGKFLRRSKLDELPQFVNILLGDMSLVGPRPEAPEIVARYTPAQACVLIAKPGITGKSQLASGEESDAIPSGADAQQFYMDHLMDGKLSADIEYLHSRTLASDARIVVDTAFYVLRSLFAPFRKVRREVSQLP